MSGHGRPASPEIHVASGDERTSVPEPHSSWISEKDWNNYIRVAPLVRKRPPSVVSIFRVPKLLKDTKKEAYVPQRVSLGPHHHGSAELRPMDHHKGRALDRMMKRFNTNMDFADRAMEEILNVEKEILKMEKEIRDSYEENIDCDGETLARMLTLDGCFILEVLKSLGDKEDQYYYEPIFERKKLEYAASDILNDILMLENQVPLIVLRKLLDLAINSAVDVQNQLPVEDILYVFNPLHAERFDIMQVEQGVHHLLDFLHTAIVSPRGEPVDKGMKCCKCCSMCTGIKCYKCCSMCTGIKCCSMCTGMLQDKNKAWDDIESIPRAVELRNAGIKFKRCTGGIKEIKFDPNSATIYLPLICITEYTEIAFRNLIAFEMCKPLEIKYVTCYGRLMDELIDSQEDVALLRRMGLLTNWLGSDQDVADLFNGLCRGLRGVIRSEDVFDKLKKEVNAHYNNKWKVQFAEFVRDHFSSPWKALALAGAIVILLFTVIQTIFSIISVYKGK